MPLHRNIRLLRWFNFLLDFRLYAPIAILYYAHVSGSYALGMSIFSLAMLATSLFEVPTGILSDWAGRKQTVVMGAFASTCSIICYAIGGRYAVLALGAILEGLARAFFSGNNDALLHDTLAESGQEAEFQEQLGKSSSMFQIALAISAILGGMLAALSYALVYWLTVIPQAINILLALQFVEPRSHAPSENTLITHLRESFNGIIHNPRLLNFTLGGIVTYAVGESAWLFRSAFISLLWPVWAIGWSQMIGNLSAAFGFYFAGRVIKRFGELRLLLAGTFFSEVYSFVLIIFPSVLSPALLSASPMFGINSVALGGLMQREFTDQQRATMASMTSFAGSLAFAVFSMLLGAFADRFGAIAALGFAAVLTAILPPFFHWRAFQHQKEG